MVRFDLKEIKELVKFMDENNLLEVEIEKEGMRLRLKKSASSETLPHMTIIPQQNTQQPIKEEIPAKSSNIEIKAPMVGTFYRAPSPDAQQYVEKNQIIEPGQVLCIIEAMKLMNEIKAETKIKIIDILIENGEPVEFGQPLFLAEPA